jgi:hypothetical protein
VARVSGRKRRVERVNPVRNSPKDRAHVAYAQQVVGPVFGQQRHEKGEQLHELRGVFPQAVAVQVECESKL